LYTRLGPGCRKKEIGHLYGDRNFFIGMIGIKNRVLSGERELKIYKGGVTEPLMKNFRMD